MVGTPGEEWKLGRNKNTLSFNANKIVIQAKFVYQLINYVPSAILYVVFWRFIYLIFNTLKQLSDSIINLEFSNIKFLC